MEAEISKYIEELTIDDTDLNTELVQQSAKSSRVGVLANTAEAEFERYKLRVKQLVASLDERIRLSALKEDKKITEAAITKEIERHPDYIKAMEHQINLYKRKEDLKNLRQDWRDRNGNLIQRCINERSEREQVGMGTVRSLSAIHG